MFAPHRQYRLYLYPFTLKRPLPVQAVILCAVRKFGFLTYKS
jgi:hypothetical protein